MQVNIPHDVHKKIMHWINKSKMEVSGFGLVKYDAKEKCFNVLDAFLLKQTVGAAHTDIDEQSHIALIRKTRGLEGALQWWWHSHVMMPVFWSGQDKETIFEMGRHGWCLATVFNQKNEQRSALGRRIKYDLGEEYSFVDEIKTVVEAEPADNRVALWDKEFDENVQEEKYESVLGAPLVVGSTATHVYFANGVSMTKEEYQQRYKADPRFSAEPGTVLSLLGSAQDEDEPEERYPSWIKDEDDVDLYDWGHVGAGVREEANALHMKHKKYFQTLKFGPRDSLQALEDRLENAIAKGKLLVPSATLTN